MSREADGSRFSVRTSGLAVLLFALALILAACGSPTTAPATPASTLPPAGTPGATAGVPTDQPTPTRLEQMLAEGRTYMDLGQYEQARQIFEAAVNLEPDLPEAHFLLGNAHYYLGELDQAAAQYQAALDLRGDYGAAHLNLGVVYYIQSGPAAGALLDQAIIEFKTAATIEPNVVENQYMLGAAYLVRGTRDDETVVDAASLDLARQAFERAIAVNGLHAPSYVGLGNVYLFQRDYARAVLQLEKATAFDSRLPEAWYALGRAYQGAGEKDKAITAYQTFLALDPQNAPDKVTQAQQALKELQGK